MEGFAIVQFSRRAMRDDATGIAPRIATKIATALEAFSEQSLLPETPLSHTFAPIVLESRKAHALTLPAAHSVPTVSNGSPVAQT